MQQFSKRNKGYRYLLMVLDLFSKYGWIVPLKDKKGETVTEAFKTIFKEGRKPQYLWTDMRKEYYNKNMKKPLVKNNITLYSTENEEKSSVCERWNRTIKTKMWKQFTVQGNIYYMRRCRHVLYYCLVSIYPADNAICGSHPIWSLSLAQAVSRQHHTPHFYCFQIQVIQRVRQARPRPKRPNSVHLEYSIHDKELGSFLLRHRIKKYPDL